MITMVYNYVLKMADGQYVSILSDDTVYGVLSEHPGTLISRNEYGYRIVTAD